jgi:hypothetical protein
VIWAAVCGLDLSRWLAENLVTLQRVAQDGMKVRASAGKSSFRRKARLEECLAEAREQVAALRKLAEENPEELTRRQQAARERAAALKPSGVIYTKEPYM